jgi:hypothetical protein
VNANKAKLNSFSTSSKLKNISSQDIFFKGIPKVMEEATEAEEEAKKKENEMKNFVHKSFVSVNEFMEEFFSLPIFKFTGKDPVKELKLISERYKDYIQKIKQKILENQTLKKKAEEHLVCLNNFISTKYAKYEIIKMKVEELDNRTNSKFYELRLSNFVPQKLNHSVWNKPIRELKWIEYEKSPHKKMESLVKCLTAVSRAYLLLSDQTDEVTADDILQFSSFIFIKSWVQNLAGYIQYIKTFHYTPSTDSQGIEQYWFITAESWLDYLSKITVEDCAYNDANFDMEIHFDTPEEFSMKDDNFL